LLQTTRDAAGRAVIGRDKLPLLAAEIMEQCDGLDGVADGAIARTESCVPKLEGLRCRGRDGSQCFTDQELVAIGRLYQGATVDGERIFPGIPPGSESLWSRWVVGTDDVPAWGERAAEGNLRLTYGIPTSQPFNPHAYVLADELDKLQKYAAILNATDPDLSGLLKQGGKLFYYHGLADPLILEGRVRQYYAEAVSAMGEAQLNEVARFMMVPGHGHCWEQTGQTADDFNPLEVIDRWVETGEAPQQVIAGSLPSAAAPGRTRKLCPYPRVAEYRGGDPELAESFSCR
jgi:hypothetical protein